MTTTVKLVLDGDTSDFELLGTLAVLDGVKDGSVFLDFYLGDFIHPHHLLFVISKVRTLDELPIRKRAGFKFIGDSINYASRMNFFDLLNISYDENFNRNEPEDNFIEITNFSGLDAYKITQKIIRMLKKHTRINKSVLIGLDYCIGEVLDNVYAHSQSVNGGWAVAQYYPRLNSIKLMVCDTGIGIHKSLSRAKEYENISEKDSLLKCIEKRVTDGEGMGMGLYFTSKFIKENKGIMTIFSGSHKLLLRDSRIFMGDNVKWKGAAFYFDIKTNVEVDLNVIADGYTDFIDSYNDMYSTNADFELW